MGWPDDDEDEDLDLDGAWDDDEDEDDDVEDEVDPLDLEAPICPWCGATALPVVPEDGDPGFVCETAGCDAYGLRL